MALTTALPHLPVLEPRSHSQIELSSPVASALSVAGKSAVRMLQRESVSLYLIYVWDSLVELQNCLLSDDG